MSERASARIVAFQEKIREERNKARGLRIFSLVGFILFVGFFGLCFVLDQGTVTLATAIMNDGRTNGNENTFTSLAVHEV